MAFKDHYKTLGVSFNATENDIRKKFRKLALQYHPDRNSDSAFAEMHFREIREAYETLTDSSRRYVYDREWLLHFPKESGMHLRQYTPESILEESIALNRQVKAMDIYRTNNESIYRQAKKILSEDNMNLLLFHQKSSINKDIITEMVSVFSPLGYKYAAGISELLFKLANNDEKTNKMIHEWMRQLKRRNYWDQYYPFAAIAIAVLICTMIYFLSR